jgi:hypothetical protein
MASQFPLAISVIDFRRWRGRNLASSHFFMEKLDELIISHDELLIVCQTAFALILDSGLQDDLDRVLRETKVQPGFAQRANQVQEKYTRERRMLIATGSIQ